MSKRNIRLIHPNGWAYAIFAAAAVCLVILPRCPPPYYGGSQPKQVRYTALISAVVDGDTVDVVFENDPPDGCAATERVRLIGVNTPEIAGREYYAEEAREFTDRFWHFECGVELSVVSARRDKYGRLLAYIWLFDDVMLNQVLIEEGCGRYYDVFAFESDYMRVFAAAEETAREAGLGLWGAP